MKIIGLFTAWASEDWIELSIKHALDLVDELIISIAPFSREFEKIEDDTYKKAKVYFNHKKIRVINHSYDPFKTPDENKCDTLNRMLLASENIKKDNYLWILDVDEFLSEHAIDEIKDFLKSNTEFDEIELKSRFFCINFNYYVKTRHIRIFKIRTEECYFTPTQHFHPKPQKRISLLENFPMFHYSMLMGEQLKGIYWLSQGKYMEVLWYKKIYNFYSPKNEEKWFEKNKKLTGNYRFWFSSDNIVEKEEGGLFFFKGKHPNIIESSQLKKIIDFRKYMKEKPNFPHYHSVMKELIQKKRKEYNSKIFETFKKLKIFIVRFVLLNNLILKSKITKLLFQIDSFIVKNSSFNSINKLYLRISKKILPNEVVYRIRIKK